MVNAAKGDLADVGAIAQQLDQFLLAPASARPLPRSFSHSARHTAIRSASSLRRPAEVLRPPAFQALSRGRS